MGKWIKRNGRMKSEEWGNRLKAMGYRGKRRVMTEERVVN